MDRRYLSPLELLSIATQHAYTADYMLQQISNGIYRGGEAIDVLSPITSLMYVAYFRSKRFDFPLVNRFEAPKASTIAPSHTKK